VLALSNAGPLPGFFTPGAVIEANPRTGLRIAARDCAVDAKSIQPEGKSPQTGAEFVRGYRVVTGERFEAASPGSLRG